VKDFLFSIGVEMKKKSGIQRLKVDREETLQKIKKANKEVRDNKVNGTKFLKALEEFKQSTKFDFLTEAEKEVNAIFSEPSRNRFIASLTMNEGTINWLDDTRTKIIKSLGELNSNWLRAYFDLHQEHEQDKKIYTKGYNKIINNTQKRKSKVGRKGKVNANEDLNKSILKIEGWDKMSNEELSVKLGWSKNRLGQILREKNWSLPQKN
jgi:hypothetical protein